MSLTLAPLSAHVFPNPASNFIRLFSTEKLTEYECAFSTNGRLMLEGAHECQFNERGRNTQWDLFLENLGGGKDWFLQVSQKLRLFFSEWPQVCPRGNKQQKTAKPENMKNIKR